MENNFVEQIVWVDATKMQLNIKINPLTTTENYISARLQDEELGVISELIGRCDTEFFRIVSFRNNCRIDAVLVPFQKRFCGAGSFLLQRVINFLAPSYTMKRNLTVSLISDGSFLNENGTKLSNPEKLVTYYRSIGFKVYENIDFCVMRANANEISEKSIGI